MITACPQCGARYRIERERLPVQGARLRCSRCEAIFRVTAPAPEPQGREAAAQRGAAERSAGVPAARPQEAREGVRRLVLVADPDVEAGKVLAGTLAGWGVEPVLVHDGVEAVLTIQRMLPSLVVLEASLPKMFGFQVCELMKRNEQLRSIPVVLVGAIHQRDRYRRQAAETYGADEYLERPQLPEALRGILRQRGIVAEPEPGPPPPPRPAPVASVQGREAAAQRGGAERSAGVPADRRPSAREAGREAAARPPSGDPDLAADIARAERLARIIVSDIVLYNPERFEAAIRAADVVGGMATEMEEGRAHFRERISERIRERRDFLGEELLRVARLRGKR